MSDYKKMIKMPVAAALIAIACQTLWGIVFPVIKRCYKLFSINTIGETYLFAGIRFIVAGLILLSLAFIRDKKMPKVSMQTFFNLLILGSIQTGLTYLLQFAAMLKASSINCSIINGTFVITSSIFAHFLFRDDRMTSRKMLGSVIAFSGVAFCFLYGGKMSGFSFDGEGLMFLSVTAFALGSVLSRVLTKGTDPVIASGYNLLFGGIEIFIVALLKNGKLANGGLEGFSLLLLLALISSVCFLVWTALLRENPAGKITIYQCANPIAGAIAASLLLGEDVFQVKYIVAIVLVSIGIVVVNSKKA